MSPRKATGEKQSQERALERERERERGDVMGRESRGQTWATNSQAQRTRSEL
jgi:hypothetical protein